MQLETTLKNIGLNDKEATAYLACLALGESSIVPLVQKTGIIRTTLLYVLERLAERGLIEIVQHATHRRYAALSPRGLVSLIKKEENRLKEQAANVEAALPELNRMYHADSFQPRVRVFKDEELREVYNEMIEEPIPDVCYVGDTTNIADSVGDRFMRDWIKRRAAKGILSNAIRIRSGEQNAPEYIAREELLRTIRYAPEGFESPAVIYIYGDNVAILTTAKESFGVVTTSKDYAKSMRSWFWALWETCEEK